MSRIKLVVPAIKAKIHEDIANIKDSEHTPLMREVDYAKKLGVSRMSVNKAMKELEHEGVLWRRKGAGTYINPAWQGQRSGSAVRVAYLYREEEIGSGVSFTAQFLRALELHARANQWWVRPYAYAMENAPGRGRSLVVAAHEAIDDGMEAVILHAPTFSQEQPVTPDWRKDFEQSFFWLKSRNLPLIVIDTGQLTWAQEYPCDLVKFNIQETAYLLIDYLLRLGHQNIGFIAYDLRMIWQQERLRGVRLAMQAAGLDLPDSRIVSLSENDKADGLLEWRKSEGLTAAICVNDMITERVLSACRNADVAVPAQWSLAGFDNYPLCRELRLTTVDFSIPEMMRQAGELLQNRLNQPWRTQHLRHVFIEPQLIERETTAQCNASEECKSGSGESR